MTMNTRRLQSQSTTQRAHFIYFPMIFASGFLHNGLLLKRALKSGGYHPEKFKMAAKFRARVNASMHLLG